MKYNKELASEYMAYIRQMAEEFGIENDVKAGALSRYPDVLTMEEQSVDEEELWAVLEGPLREACEKFAQAREREGEHLKNDLITVYINFNITVDVDAEGAAKLYRENDTAEVVNFSYDAGGFHGTGSSLIKLGGLLAVYNIF